jgi:hypothetical protein
MINITCSNSITTVQQDSNLEKNYFNIKGKFYTQGTIFYIFLDNDVYEIPLDKLEVNGSSQSTMQDGINALATILVNAGSSGGGGVTNYWDLTFAADDGVNLSLNGFIATYPGVYIIVGAGDGTYAFEAPAASSYPGQTMTIVNIDLVNASIGSANTTIQYADGGSLVQLPSLTSVVLVSGNSANVWWVVSQYTI